MNLIEQLGGYDFVKKMWIDGGSLRGTQLEFELLEYRRQHNIFEAGDEVVHLYESDEIFKIKSIKGDYFIIEGNRNTLIGISFLFDKTCRHATDEEIKAGHRL